MYKKQIPPTSVVFMLVDKPTSFMQRDTMNKRQFSIPLKPTLSHLNVM